MNTTLIVPPTIDWSVLMPVIVVALGGIIALLIEMFRPLKDNTMVVVASLAALICAGASIIMQLPLPSVETFAQMAMRDRPSLLLQLLIVSSTFLIILFSEPYLRSKRIPFAEFYALALWSASGAMIMVSTKSLLMLFVGLEILSIALYVMAGMSKSETRSEESAIKYFLLGAFASAFLLFGIAYVYGATGSLHMDAITRGSMETQPLVRIPLTFGVALILIGLLFKGAFAPFHQWTPDVYQGAPTNVTAFMAAVSKVAAIGALWRLLDSAVGLKEFYLPILIGVAVLTMVLGNVAAIIQTDVKRVLGFSSIANAGYILVGIIAHLKEPEKVGISTTIFYLAGYTVMTIGAFAVISLTAKKGREGTEYKDLAGLWQRSKLATTALVVFVVGLIGIPPFAGFFGKLYIWRDAVSVGLLPLSAVMALSSVVGIYYYVGIIRAALVDSATATSTLAKPRKSTQLAFILCLIGIFMMVGTQSVMDFIQGNADQVIQVTQK